MRFPIKRKIWAFVGAITALMAISGGYIIQQMLLIGGDLDTLAKFNTPLTEQISELEHLQLKQTAEIRQYLSNYKAKHYEAFSQQATQSNTLFQQAWSLFDNHKSKSESREYLEELISDFSDLSDEFQSLAIGLHIQINSNNLEQLKSDRSKLTTDINNLKFETNHLIIALQGDLIIFGSDNNKLILLQELSKALNIQQRQAQIIESYFDTPKESLARDFEKLSEQTNEVFFNTETTLKKILDIKTNTTERVRLDENKISIKKLENNHFNFETRAQTLIDQLREANIYAINRRSKEIKKISNQLELSASKLLKELDQRNTIMVNNAESHEHNTLTIFAILLSATLTLSAVMAWYLARNISGGLKRLSNATQKLSEGDLSSQLTMSNTQSRDELEDLAKLFQDMQDSYKTMAKTAGDFASGNLSEIISPRSDLDEFGQSLAHMMEQVKDRNLELEKNDARTQGIVNTAIDGILLINHQGIIESFNTGAEKQFNYSKDEVIGKNVSILMPKKHAENHNTYINNYMETGIKKIIGQGRELEAKRKDGSTFPIFLSVTELNLSGDRYFTGIIRDISKEKSAQLQLKERSDIMESQNWQKTQIAKIISTATSSTTIQEMANLVTQQISKITESGHGVFYIINTKSKDPEFTLAGSYAYKERKHIANTIKQGEGIIGQAALEQHSILLTQAPSDYIKINSGLGEAKPLNILAQPIAFEGETLSILELASFSEFSTKQLDLIEEIGKGLGVVINNIISRQRIEALLEESQRQGEQLQTQQEELKTSNEELESQARALKESQARLESQQQELKTSNLQLEKRQQEVQLQNQKLEISRNELEEKGKALELSSKYKSEFLANMSHELRTPLNSLLILSNSLASNKEGNLTEKQIKAAQVINEGGTSLLDMINDILDLSKVEAGKLDLQVTPVSISDLCNSVKSMFDLLAEEKGLKFEVAKDKNTEDTIESDSQRLEQILRNFLSNAFKFTDAGSVNLHIHKPDSQKRFSSTQLNTNNCLAISVEDTGTGIATEKKEVIFEAFQQQDGSISRKYGGTGLGLTISRELSRLLQGEIQLESELGQGSCFTLYIPIKFPSHSSDNTEDKTSLTAITSVTTSNAHTAIDQTKNASSIAETKPLIKESNPNQSKSISNSTERNDKGNYLLIIEDDINLADSLADIAKEQRLKVVCSHSGREGLYRAIAEPPKAILLDIGLPDIDGFEVLDQLRANANTQNIPVHVISGREQNNNSISHGAYGFSLKPVQEIDVKKALINLDIHPSQPVERLLVVEDDSGQQIAIDQLLHSPTTQVEFADSGEKAVTMLGNNHPFDCVILDLGLPDIDGLEVLEKIRSLPNAERIPVIIYTGREIDEALQEKLHSFSCDIIIKGAESPQRLLDDVALFVHHVNEHNPQKNSTNEANETLKGRRILLVDDDIRNTYALSGALEDEGLNVDIADNGARALELADINCDYELILMDIMMPEMDGFEATRNLRKLENYRDTPIIALTAKAMPEDRAACLQAGASEYLAKPIDMPRLLAMLKVWLYRR